MKTLKRVLPVLLSGVMALSCASPALAADSGGSKEEVVYIMTDTAGSVKRIDVVNIFGSGAVCDYGNYSEVKMLNTDDEIRKEGDKITFSTNEKRAYYQGTMENTEIPWNISIRYFLDGQEYPAEEVAGKSGHLKVEFTVAKNEQFEESFYDDYALQAAFLLDTYRCSNIDAPDATAAEVGSDKQLSYTILPGQGIDTFFEADVNDFEMDAVSINGVKLKLDVEVDDSEMMDRIGEMINGMIDIDDGADSLHNGASDLQDGGASLMNGASSLKSGINSLDIGIDKLKEGIASAQSGLEMLDSKSSSLVEGSAAVRSALQTIQSSLSSVSLSTEKFKAMTDASSTIQNGIGELSDDAKALNGGLGYAQYKAAMSAGGLDIDALLSGNTQAIADLSAQIGTLQTKLAATTDETQIAALTAQISQLETVVNLLGGNNAAIGGTESYLSGVSGAMGQLDDGLDTLNTQYAAFDSSIGALAETLTGMISGLSTLSLGIDQLVVQYGELDDGIVAYTGGVAALVSGYSTIMDGVSDLAEGSGELAGGSGNLYNGTVDLYNGISSLCDGSKELANGTGEMRDETSDMDGEVQDKIDDMLASIKGDDSKAVSFVSGKNKDVKSVQFVIKTEEIEKQVKEKVESCTEKTPTLWEKFLSLFGVDS